MKSFLVHSKNIDRDGYLWNMIGSVLQSFQSVIFLMILTRTVGLLQAGIFTIAYANANLFLNIGKYGMRYYQVSDIQEQYTFKEYACSRGITVAIMMVVSIVYTCYVTAVNGYSSEKFWVIIWMCIYKAVDAIEDVFEGKYQQRGRLDIASKVLVIRSGAAVLIYAMGLVFLQNQLYALVIATIVSYVLMVWFLYYTETAFGDYEKTIKTGQVAHLLKSCFPLFIGCFLSFYIGNAPKYAIDAQLSDEIQACYGFIAMPVFVVGMLNSFVFNPLLYRMSMLWEERKISTFIRYILIQAGVIVLITFVCMVGAWGIGIPILSWMYHTDLTLYKTSLLVLLLGGGFLSLSGLLNAMITIIRFQKSITYGYVGVAALAHFLSAPVVRVHGIFGAAVLYTALMEGLCICFGGFLMLGICKRVNYQHDREETFI